ncbi:hypothetical protein [Edwardsiella piscicida]|uniref:hypothetical protein n=1 Tax=Edwardsiella piscicida TaxID=1263550 RepID=UPI0035DDDE54
MSQGNKLKAKILIILSALYSGALLASSPSVEQRLDALEKQEAERQRAVCVAE